MTDVRPPPRTARTRRATTADAPALTRLRAVMLDGVGRSGGFSDAAWRPVAEAWFRHRLAQPDQFAAFVVDDPDDPEHGPVSSACGICDARPPGPVTLSTVRGHVFSVATDPDHRRRGHARACMAALLGWFREQTPVEVVELKASAQGRALYAELGFRDVPDPAVRLAL